MIVPENEARLMLPLGIEGRHVLEFGDKRNPTGLYRDWYLERGAASYTSVDINGKNGALAFDVRDPLEGKLLDAVGRTTFDLVTNFGFSEHVQTKQHAFFANCHRLCAVGGHMVHCIPRVGHWRQHPHMYFAYTHRFLDALAADNKYATQAIAIDQSVSERSGLQKDLVAGVLTKVLAEEFGFLKAGKQIMPQANT